MNNRRDTKLIYGVPIYFRPNDTRPWVNLGMSVERLEDDPTYSAKSLEMAKDLKNSLSYFELAVEDRFSPMVQKLAWNIGYTKYCLLTHDPKTAKTLTFEEWKCEILWEDCIQLNYATYRYLRTKPFRLEDIDSRMKAIDHVLDIFIERRLNQLL